MKNSILLTIALALIASNSHAGIKTKTIEYTQGDTKCIGFLAWDDSNNAKSPGVLVIPEWWGLTDYPKERAKQLAQLGYVAFVADMYGQGKTTSDPKEAGSLAGALKGDRKLLRARAAAALDVFKTLAPVDSTKIAAIGYCFGGTTVLELALSGADVRGVVSFHGSLDFPTLADDVKNIKGSALVCHGSADSFVPREQVNAFIDATNKAKVDCTLVEFSGALHSFTNPKADNFGIDGVKYDEKADRRSWGAMQMFFKEVFK